MREFIIVGHQAWTKGFSLNDIPGAGRMDILCRCINGAFFLSHDLRRDVVVHLLLLGDPDPPKIVRFEGARLKYLNPDERSAASLIGKALEKKAGNLEAESTPGVYIRRGALPDLLAEHKTIYYLREDGEDIRRIRFEGEALVFILGDHLGMTQEEEAMILNSGAEIISIGPKPLHADHCIIIIQNELDRVFQ